MKNIIQYISKVFTKKNTEETLANDNYMDIMISLDKNFNINTLVYMNPKKIENISENENILVYYEFLNSSFTENIQKIILEVLNKDINTDNNISVINGLNKLFLYRSYITEETTYIKPSEVFSKYIPK